MSEQHKKNEKNFLIQGSILAIAGVITKLIGAFYRIPLLNIIGTEGIHPRTIPPKECMERNTGSHCCRFRIDGNRLLGGDVRAGIASGHHA